MHKIPPREMHVVIHERRLESDETGILSALQAQQTPYHRHSTRRYTPNPCTPTTTPQHLYRNPETPDTYTLNPPNQYKNSFCRLRAGWRVHPQGEMMTSSPFRSSLNHSPPPHSLPLPARLNPNPNPNQP